MILWGSPDSRDRGRDARRRARPRPSGAALRHLGRATWTCASPATRSWPSFKRDLPALLARHTERLAVRNLTVEWADDIPAYFTHAIEAESFRELLVDGFRGRQAQEAGSAIRLASGEDAIVRDSRAATGTDTFVEVDRGDGPDGLRRKRCPSRAAADRAGFVRPPGRPEPRTRSRRPERVDSGLPARRPSCRPCVDRSRPRPSSP
ncbi:MAG: hypothetical protein MZU95_14945 [Desulfomicrobium escambiense]|nr:hypothetical protein [Desulfomicrobium escambiense]